jgi:2'-5' RNA ligase
MKEIGIICLLPEEVNNYCQELRLKIAMQFGFQVNFNIPAHITVKYCFPVEDVDEIEKMVQEFCAFPVKVKWLLQDFSHFANDNNFVVFIDAVASEETRKAHSGFLDRLREISWVQWGEFDNANLQYHVTLAAQGITAENFESVWSFVNQQEKPNYEVFFDNLTLIQIDEDSRSIYKIYQFQN